MSDLFTNVYLDDVIYQQSIVPHVVSFFKYCFVIYLITYLIYQTVSTSFWEIYLSNTEVVKSQMKRIYDNGIWRTPKLYVFILHLINICQYFNVRKCNMFIAPKVRNQSMTFFIFWTSTLCMVY